MKQGLEITLSSMERSLGRMAQDVSRNEDRHIREARREFFRWLSPVDSEVHHREISRGTLAGTGQWLLNSTSYVGWLHSSSSSIFWLHGMPGVGKTNLTSIVSNTFRDEAFVVSPTIPPSAFFYASRNPAEPELARPVEIWRAILRQLCIGIGWSPLRASLADEYQRRKSRAEFGEGTVETLDIDETTEWVLKIAANYPLVIVIDGFDEIDGLDSAEFLDILKRVVKESANVTKIFISSRNEEDISEALHGCANIGITESLVREDLKYFIVTQVDKAISRRRLLRGKVSPALKREILDTFLQKASGT